jgi:hypothetical protein
VIPAISHDLIKIETSVSSGLVQARCLCDWTSGWRRSREAALVAHDGHLTRMYSMTPEQAKAILNDHTYGLHEEHDTPDGCRWIGCDEAFWVIAKAEKFFPNNPSTRSNAPA